MLHRFRGFIGYLVLRLLFRLRIDRKIFGATGTNTHIAQDRISELLEHLSDSDLDLMAAGANKEEFSEEISRIVEMFRTAGVDIMQEVRNEKLLRDHRKKHEKVS